jgi:inner membrane protein
MPSPIGHLLGGTAAYLIACTPSRRGHILLAVTLLASIAPDFDFVPGILIGDMRAFHHGISHSLTFALVFGALVFLIMWWVERAVALPAAILAICAYTLHVLLDFVSVTQGRGVPLLWPISRDQLGIDAGLFGHFRYSDIRDGIWSVVRRENVLPIARELAILGGLVAAVLWRRKFVNLVLRRSSRMDVGER